VRRNRDEPSSTATNRIRHLLASAHPRHHRRRARVGGGGKPILLLAVLMAAVLAVLVVNERATVAALSGTAAIEVTGTAPQTGGEFDPTSAGTWIHYTYVVDGKSFNGAAFRRWSYGEGHAPKVCFDPRDPARHRLVAETVTCGEPD
jgi:uncharacterized membrane protein